MRHGMAMLTVLTLALTVLGQDLSTADSGRCIRTSIDENTYSCSGTEVEIQDGESNVLVNCRGQILDCSKLQQLQYGGSKILHKLTVQNCFINSSVVCVLHSLNSTGATSLFVKAGRTPLTNETVRGLDTLQSIFIFYGPQSTIPVNAVKQLKNLKTLRILSAKISSIPSNIFKENGISELLSLDMSLNNIEYLPADAFNGLGKLVNLSLFKNNFQEVDINAFRGLDSLKGLSLDENSFSVVPSDLFVNVPLLEYLTIPKNKNNLHVKAGAFSGLNHLVELVLSSNKEMKLDNASLANLPSLTDLTMKESDIRELPPDLLINTTAVVRLFLNSNKLRSLPESVFSGLVKLEKLDLSYNQLEVLSAAIFNSLVELKELLLDDNLIETLPDKLFYSMVKLQKVSFSRNRISFISETTFNKKVTFLNLSHNRLPWNCITPEKLIDPEKGSYGTFERFNVNSPLSNLNDIQTLDLSYNKISSICNDWTDTMKDLKVLDLSHNKLTKITEYNITFVSQDIKVDLRDNQITSVQYPTYTEIIRSKPNMMLGRNPFHCDCFLYRFLKELKDHFDVKDATCHHPKSLNGVTLGSIAQAKLTDSVSLTNLTCPLPEMPHNCFCIVRPAMNRTECDCKDIQNNTLPDPTLNGPTTRGMRLALKTVEHVHFISKFVQGLDLSSLRLTTVPLGIPDTVKHVDLRNNKLSSVPLEFLQRNITLTLGNNPLECGCWEAEDVKHLQKYRLKIKDYDILACSDNVTVKQVDTERLCDKMQAIAIGSSLSLFGLIIAVAVALAYKYSVEIKVYLYNNGWLASKYLDTKKKFDIFVSYNHADKEFVEKNLLPELEKYYKVCNHSRDWVIGARIVDQIVYSVEQSRRTLIVLSNACLPKPGTTTWVVAEFEAAVMQTQQDQLQRTVVVLLEDMNFDNAPELIRNHVKMNTYITWGETLFWVKLRKALPRKLKVDDVKRKRAAKSLGNGGLNVVLNKNGVLVNASELMKEDAQNYIKPN